MRRERMDKCNADAIDKHAPICFCHFSEANYKANETSSILSFYNHIMHKIGLAAYNKYAEYFEGSTQNENMRSIQLPAFIILLTPLDAH